MGEGGAPEVCINIYIYIHMYIYIYYNLYIYIYTGVGTVVIGNYLLQYPLTIPKVHIL